MLEPVSFSKGQDIEPPKDFKGLFLKYFNFWHWFVIGVSIALISSYFYINSAPVIYTTKARIKIHQFTKNKIGFHEWIFGQYDLSEFEKNQFFLAFNPYTVVCVTPPLN